MHIICQYVKKNDLEYVRIEIEDTGVGISQEDQKQLFRLFGFIDASRNLNPKGIGLGLYISKLISEKFGGSVGVTSEVDQGSTFVFSFELKSLKTDVICEERTLNPF